MIFTDSLTKRIPCIDVHLNNKSIDAVISQIGTNDLLTNSTRSGMARQSEVDSSDYSDRTCFVLRIIKKSYSYFLLFIFISLVGASSGDSVILFISDKDSFID